MDYRLGKVSEQDKTLARVRVTFGADDALVSWWLPVIQPKTHADRVYWMPDIGEHVVCLLDEHAAAGVVLGAIYSEADATPVASLDKLHVAMKDGTTVEYDRATHRLHVHVASGDVVLEVDDGATVHVGGEAGQELATKQFIQQQFNTHTHPSTQGPTGPPMQPSPLAPGSDITKKTKGE